MPDYKVVRRDGKTQYEHRVLMNAPKGMVVDHINGDTRDNSSENLRVITHQQNVTYRQKLNKNNTSGHRNVRPMANGRWVVRLKINYKGIHVGCYETFEEACDAYHAIAKEVFGEFRGVCH